MQNVSPSDKEYNEACDFYHDFLKRTANLTIGDNFQKTWYRGQSKNWPLLPGVLRIPGMDHIGSEAGILISFKRIASEQMDRELSSREWYYLAQHHGLPTRFLDWTLSPRIALWFAVQKDEYKDEDGYIYIINSGRYMSEGFPKIKSIADEYYELVFGSGDLDSPFQWTGQIFSIFPETYCSRQLRQSSIFTMHFGSGGNQQGKVINTEPLNEGVDWKDYSLTWDEHLHKNNDPVSIRIPAKYKCHLRRLLSNEGLHRWDVFPDLDNIAKGLKEEM